MAPVGSGPGSWAGAPSALLHDGVFYLAYRLRQPIGRGRGIANIVARSRDGVRFTTVATLRKEAFGAESLERPAIAVTPGGHLARVHQRGDARHQALRGRVGSWDERGTRVAAVRLDQAEPIAYYDGRATAEENWEERTGVALITGLDSFEAIGDAPVAMSSFGLGGLRYVSALRLPDGSTRFYYEVTRPDGAHELRTTLVKE